MEEMQTEHAVPAIVAEVDGPAEAYASQMAEMDRRLRDLEAAIGDLRTVQQEAAPEPAAPVQAAASPVTAGRKTLPAHTAHLLSKQGVNVAASEGKVPEAQALDAALSSLSVEQRIAVKSQMLRAGLLR